MSNKSSANAILDSPFSSLGLFHARIHLRDGPYIWDSFRLEEKSTIRETLTQMLTGNPLSMVCSPEINHGGEIHPCIQEKLDKIQNHLNQALANLGEIYVGPTSPFIIGKHSKFYPTFYLKTKDEALACEAPDIQKFKWKFESLYKPMGKIGPCQIYAYINSNLVSIEAAEIHAHIRALRFSLEKNRAGLAELNPYDEPFTAVISDLIQTSVLTRAKI